ncbi:uncharacterized protein LOC128890589 [Hylaeus anthracinus]|uniref:uncharacterized protein LOC128890589 n=1 Tax=Hylaeus anthracinus TaxID=313031 RepID=UPI0023B9DDB7|nr:uncharacterized protein LOC128890589 [Hylaeus anthracinus]
MFVVRCGLLISVLTVVSGDLPMWHHPCGDGSVEIDGASMANLREEARISLERLMLQHQMTMYDYLNRDYDYLYESVRIGVHDHQYIPNWIPGKKDVSMIKRLADRKQQTIINHFPKMHRDLQKFAVAFEELVDDETNSQVHNALEATQNSVKAMLCEVESYIVAFTPLEVPPRVERSIMTSIEREPVDDTRRLIRDWGILHKYRDYLHAWRHVFNY